MQTRTEADIDDIGFFAPDMTPVGELRAGEVGYVITGIKEVSRLRVGDTLTHRENQAREALPGYKEVKPMVFCGLFPVETDDFEDLRDALEKLALNDAALSYEPETSQALGFGFRCGFLGLLHMDIVRERLEREYDLSLLATTPNVEYDVILTDGSEVRVHSPADMPDPARDRRGPRALHQRDDPLPQGGRRPGDGAVPGAPRHARRDDLPVGGARAAPVRPAAGGDRARLLRPAEVADEGLRLARLRDHRRAPVGPREDGHHARRRHGRRAVDGRPQGQGLRARPRARPRGCASRSRASSSRSRSRRRSGRRSSRASPSRPCART